MTAGRGGPTVRHHEQPRLRFHASIFVISLGLWAWLPAVLLRVALMGRFGAAFEFGEIAGFIRRHLVNYLLSLAAVLVASFLAQFGILLCCVGFFATTFLSYCILAFNVGELARLDAGR